MGKARKNPEPDRSLDQERLASYGTTASELGRLVQVLEERQPRTHGHSCRVAAHAAAMGTELGLAIETVRRLHAAALLHDIGKIRTPTQIVDKPARLSDEEYAEIRRHAEVGAALVAPLGDPALTAIVRHHHERFDGTGYPAGLSGYEIPLGARIVAVADTLDALVSPRPYRPALPREEAMDLLSEAAGTQLDPTVVRVALRLAGRPRPPRRRGRFAPPPGSEDAAAPALPLRRPPG